VLQAGTGRASDSPVSSAAPDSGAAAVQSGCSICEGRPCRHVHCGDAELAADDRFSIHDRLEVLRTRLNYYSNGHVEASLEGLIPIFTRISHTAEYPFDCLMAAGALREVAANAVQRIQGQKDLGGKKKDPVEVLAAHILAARSLNACQ